MTSQNRVDDDIVEFFHAAGEHFAITDADYRIEHVSSAFQVLLESPIEELRGSTFFDWIDAEDRPFSEGRRERAETEGSAWRSGGKLRRKGGKTQNAWWTWTRSADGLKRFAVIRPIESAPEGAQQESSTVRLRSLSQNIPLAVLETDVNASLVSWNPAAERIFGFSEEEVLGKRPEDLFPSEDDGTQQTQFIEQLLSPPHVARIQRWIQRKDGERRLIDWTGSLKRTDAGEIGGLLIFADDITDKERVLEDLQRHVALIEEQRDKLRSLSAPVLQIWEGVLVVPVIGTIDSERAHGIMEALLFAITARRSHFAVLDLTGVENLDAATADHLLKVMGAIRLLGAQGLFCGIRPQVAQILTEIEVDLSSVVTLATLHEALAYCISRLSARGR